MEAIRALLSNYWISKSRDKELYLKAKRTVNKHKRFLTEQLGWKLIINDRIIKLEKTPAHAESFMGITEFQDPHDYCILCALLLFLEDKEDGEQFLLSELVAMIEAQLSEYMDIDWTVFAERKSLVRVLKYAERMEFVTAYDGSIDSVSREVGSEVLYENTGISRYFAVSFDHNIDEMKTYRDFEEAQIRDTDTDRGHFRINRVYRRLVTSPAMYWSSNDDADSLYLKNQRQWIAKYMEENLGGSLQIHKSAVFFVLDENDTFAECHPKDAAISDVVLNMCAELRLRTMDNDIIRDINAGGDEISEEIKGEYVKGNARTSDDCLYLSEDKFRDILKECRKKNIYAWSKEYRDIPFDKLERNVIDYMESWMLLKRDEGKIIILPATGKIIGEYPADYLQKEAMKENG